MAATWSFVGIGQSTPAGAVTSVTIAPATGTAQGDIIICTIANGDLGGTSSGPVGWYKGGSGTDSGVLSIAYFWTKLGSAPSATYQFTFSVAMSSVIGVLATYRGAEFGNDYTGSPVFPNATGGAGGATTASGTAINSTDDLHFCAWTAAGATHNIAVDAALTSRFSVDSADATTRLCGGEEALTTTAIPARTSSPAGTFHVNCSSNHGDAKWPQQGEAWAWLG